jgi:hypothetical protein
MNDYSGCLPLGILSNSSCTHSDVQLQLFMVGGDSALMAPDLLCQRVREEYGCSAQKRCFHGENCGNHAEQHSVENGHFTLPH